MVTDSADYSFIGHDIVMRLKFKSWTDGNFIGISALFVRQILQSSDPV
jgi:hypothetical protein